MGIGNHSLRTCLLLLTCAILVAGCTKVGPDYVRPETAVSQTWLEAGDQRVKTEPAEYRDWWKAFNDPTLDRLIDSAYRENLTLRIAPGTGTGGPAPTGHSHRATLSPDPAGHRFGAEGAGKRRDPDRGYGSKFPEEIRRPGLFGSPRSV